MPFRLSTAHLKHSHLQKIVFCYSVFYWLVQYGSWNGLNDQFAMLSVKMKWLYMYENERNVEEMTVGKMTVDEMSDELPVDEMTWNGMV